MNAPYEPPTITRLVSGLMNKFGNRPAPNRQVRAAIDGVAIEDLVAAHGSPLFAFSEKTLARTVRRARDAFARRRPRIELAWSYKTNYLRAICALMHREGSLAEVVSAMEYDKARGLGVPGHRIVFNGPLKPMAALRRAVAEDALVNVDHDDELDDLSAIARERGDTVPVGLRLNLDAGILPQWSRFGFNLESGAALAAVERIARSGCLRLRGLHCHLGTFILDPTAYARQIDKLAALAETVRARFGSTLEYLDLGGGLPSRNRLKGTYLPSDVATPPIEDYADAIVEALDRHWHPDEGPRVILEPGRALVDEAGTLIASVVSGKRLPDGTPSYVLDAGVNLLYTATWYDFDIGIERALPGAPQPSVLYGPLCMNIDVVRDRVSLPPLPRGTRLTIGPVGAYTVTQSMQFIQCRPAVVLIGEDGAVDVIREREDLSDIERRERLPERLAARTTSRADAARG